jgi:hypothetical protein
LPYRKRCMVCVYQKRTVPRCYGHVTALESLCSCFAICWFSGEATALPVGSDTGLAGEGGAGSDFEACATVFLRMGA